MDPTEEEEKQMNGMVVVATLPSLNEVSHVIQAGELEAEQAIDVSLLIYDLI
jgi:exosome complex RNA-binding protein Rrp42 (RNase PH superfamily)